MGKAGAVFGIEVSRLARSNADWHRLLDLCATTDTLVIDDGKVHDPASYDDRLLLGLKGTIACSEIWIMLSRLQGGRYKKALNGEYRVHFYSRTGSPWNAIPAELGAGSGPTCWRRFRTGPQKVCGPESGKRKGLYRPSFTVVS